MSDVAVIFKLSLAVPVKEGCMSLSRKAACMGLMVFDMNASVTQALCPRF